MTIRTGWQDRFAMALQTSGITSTIDFSAGSGKGIAGANQYGIPITNKPDLAANLEYLQNQKSLGISQRRVGTGYELTSTIKRPSVSLEFAEADAYVLTNLAWLFFQTGASETPGSPNAYTFAPYTTPNAEVWASVCRAMSDQTGTDWQVVHGGILNNLNLRGGEDTGVLAVTGDLLCNAFSETFDPSNTADAQVNSYPEKAPLLWKNATCTLDGTNILLPGFDASLTNGAVLRFFDEATGQKFILQMLTGTVNFRVPWDAATVGDNEQITKYVNGTDVKLTVRWGTTTDGDCLLSFNVRYTGAPLEVGDEIETALTGEIVYDGTNNGVAINTWTGYDLAIS